MDTSGNTKMSIEQKAKAYDEALEKAKFYHGNCPSEPERKKLEKMFPALRESEDERIKRELIEYLRGDLDDITTDDTDRWISWLEKQKEQKEPELAEVIKDRRQIAFMVEEGRMCGEIEGRKQVIDNLEKYGLQKPAEWSEDDEQYLLICKNALSKYQRSDQWDANIISNWLEKRLKSLRPSWKPSEEQMDALKELIDDANKTGWVTPGATELYEQLKKL